MSRQSRLKRPRYEEDPRDSEDESKSKMETTKSKYFAEEGISVEEQSGSEVVSDDVQDDSDSIDDNEYSASEASEEEEEASSSSESMKGSSVGVKRPRKKGVKQYRKLDYQDQLKSNFKTTKKAGDSGRLDNDEEVVTGEIFIRKLPALPEGDTPFKPSTIHSNSLTFLRDLRLNNERDWFQQRDLQYQSLKLDFDTFILSLGDTIRSIDETIPELPVKDLTFRIYRDIRFSNDRTPYKTFLAAYYSRSGRKGPWAGYYFSLEPNDKTLLACGLWQPPPQDLALVRESISSDIETWNSVINDPGFLEFFGGRNALLKTEDRLKTCPKGFNKDHKEIELLRLKSFNAQMTFKDEEVVQDGFLEILGAVVSQMEPFVTMLNMIIRPETVESESE